METFQEWIFAGKYRRGGQPSADTELSDIFQMNRQIIAMEVESARRKEHSQMSAIFGKMICADVSELKLSFESCIASESCSRCTRSPAVCSFILNFKDSNNRILFPHWGCLSF